MKKRILQLGFSITIALLASTAMADKVVIYNGYHGDGYGRDRGDYRRNNGYRYNDDYRRRGGYSNHGHHHKHGHKHRRGYRKYARHQGYRPYNRRPVYREKRVYRQYVPARRYAPVPRYGYHSATPVIAGSLIGGIIGAELSQGGPLTFGGALLGASIGRDIAHRHHH